MNLQFSCSFFLQGEGTPNGRLRERAGRWDMFAAWEAWIVRCAGIAAAYEIARGVAAHGVVAGIASSRSMAAVSAVSAESPRYSEFGGLEGAAAAAPESSEAAELAAIAALGVS